MLRPRVAIIVAKYNHKITSSLLDGALKQFEETGVIVDERHIFHVPGAVELPIAAKRCALSKQFDLLVVFGAVIKGETDHYDYVSQSVTYGCQKVALEENIPVIFGVLTTPTYVQAVDRVGGARGHHGREAANSAIELLKTLSVIDDRVSSL